jgi:hypothetical protein
MVSCGDRRLKSEGRREQRKNPSCKENNFGAFWSVCPNVGSCLRVLTLLHMPGASSLVWYFVCLKQSLAFEVRTVLANSRKRSCG